MAVSCSACILIRYLSLHHYFYVKTLSYLEGLLASLTNLLCFKGSRDTNKVSREGFFPSFESVKRKPSGVPKDGFFLNALKSLFGLSRVLLDLKKCIVSGAEGFVSVRSS